MSNLLENEFAVISTIQVAWGEMDAFGHVNNSVYFRYFETGRTEYLEKLGVCIGQVGPKQAQAVGPILKSISALYKGPIYYPDTLSLGTRITKIETDRFHVKHAIASEQSGRIVTEGEGVIVTYDYHADCKTAVPESWIKKIKDLEKIQPETL